ncbi:MAG: hypothetical protein ACI9NT_000483 [Bacteroidia bacterium]
MSFKFYLPALLQGTALLAMAPLCAAANLDLSVTPGLTAALKADETTHKVSPGIDFSVKNSLFKVALDYKFQAQVDEQGLSSKDLEAQRVGAAFNSQLLDRLLGVKTQLRANSQFRNGGDSYRHQLAPGFSRTLLTLATLDVGYQYNLNKASDAAVTQEVEGYSLGLKGKFAQGRLSWSGAWQTFDTHRGDPLTLSTESFKFRSDYQIVPQMKLRISSAIKQSTHFAANSEQTSAEVRYGAGFSWAPSEQYTVTLAVNHLNKTQTGEDQLLRSGSFNWQPIEEVQFSVNYGDQLVEGEPGVLFTTRLDLGRL